MVVSSGRDVHVLLPLLLVVNRNQGTSLLGPRSQLLPRHGRLADDTSSCILNVKLRSMYLGTYLGNKNATPLCRCLGSLRGLT